MLQEFIDRMETGAANFVIKEIVDMVDHYMKHHVVKDETKKAFLEALVNYLQSERSKLDQPAPQSEPQVQDASQEGKE
ncbi:MAG: hypothetical protein KGI50_05435 [Patescibacteria group bacterium]|nr:hypothetical protein [Patescibacteria group bacterium]MDE2438752.1 hypothetical protein [Patescibacteria group bacterium]